MIDISSVFFLIILFTINIYLYRKVHSYVFFLSIFLFIFKILLILIDDQFKIIPYVWDSLQFEELSMIIYERLRVGNFNLSDINSSGTVFYYSLFSAFLYLPFSPSFLIPRFFNVFISSIFTLNLYKVSILLLNRKKSIFLYFLFSFLPSYFIFSIVFMRDTIVNFIFISILLNFLYLIKNGSRFAIFNVFFFTIISYFLREFNPLLIFTIFMIYGFIMILIKKNVIKKIIAFLILGLFVFIIFNYSNQSLNFVSNYMISQLNYRASGGALYLFNIIETPIDLLVNFPSLFINFLYYPSFNQINNVFSFIVFFETLIYRISSVLFILFFFERISKLRKISKLFDVFNTKAFYFMIIMFFVTSSVSSLITANGGTAFRQRMFMIYLIPIISLFFMNKSKIRFHFL